jgi:uncharacterized protein YbjT (DUF2867 family)
MFKHTILIPQINYAYFCPLKIKVMALKAVLAGATGLIGSELLKILLTAPEYDQILVVARKSTGFSHPKLKELLIDFDKLDDHAGEINGHAVFCTLGTTKKKTPDMDTYRKIDHDYPVKLAQLAAKNGVEQYHLISSLGADPKASSFYLRFKGETEENVKLSGVKSIHIYEPSFITGDRKEFRPAEKILLGLFFVVNPLLIGGLKKYRSIPAKTIAQAMFNQSIKNNEGIHVYPSDKIKELA